MTIVLVLFVAGNLTRWYQGVFLWMGTTLGMFFPDLEYLLYAYFIDPSAEKSREVRSFISKRNFNGFVKYLEEKEYSFGELSIRSVLFLFVLMIFIIYAGAGRAFILIQGLALSMYATLLYSALMEFVKTRTLKRWFWMMNVNFHEKEYSGFLILLFVIYIVLFSFIV
jgi:hypothetical protein